MTEHRIGVIMNGVTGRMGTNQHLMRSIAEIIKQGGVRIGPGETIMPDPILIGRDENKLKKLCQISGVKKMSTDLDEIGQAQVYADATLQSEAGLRSPIIEPGRLSRPLLFSEQEHMAVHGPTRRHPSCQPNHSAILQKRTGPGLCFLRQ